MEGRDGGVVVIRIYIRKQSGSRPQTQGQDEDITVIDEVLPVAGPQGLNAMTEIGCNTSKFRVPLAGRPIGDFGNLSSGSGTPTTQPTLTTDRTFAT